MRKILPSLFFFISLFFAGTSSGQKIPVAAKQLLFKTPAYWQQNYVNRLRSASPEIVSRINQFNADALKNGYTFRIAYTIAWGKPISTLTGAKIPNPKKPGYYPPASYSTMPLTINSRIIEATAADTYYDARDYGIITKVQNQNPCGSCWAHGSVASLETAFLLKNGGDASLLDLSEQQVLNCTGVDNTCSGGWNNDAASYICNHNIAAESDYKYTAKDSMCGGGNNIASIYKGRRWGWVGGSVPEIKQAIIEHGSVNSCIWFSDELHNYGGGVYNLDNPAPFGQINHVIQIIGWNDTTQAWLIKNSWGTDWGEGGFAWVKYNINNLGRFCLWIEAEATGKQRELSGNPFSGNTGEINFSASYDVLKALYDKSSFCRIENRYSHKLVEVDDPVTGPEKGRRVQQWESHGQLFAGSDGHNQEWFFIQAGQQNKKPVYKIFNYGFNNFLTDAGTSNPICERENGTWNQLWYIMPQGNKTLVKIKNVNSGKYLEAPTGNGLTNNGVVLQMNWEGNQPNQLFDLSITFYNPIIPIDKPFYLLPKHAPSLALDVPAANTSNGIALQVWQKITNNKNQAWLFSWNNVTGYFRLHPGLSPQKSLEVLGISLSPGARVGLWDSWDGENQEWLVIRVARENDRLLFFNRNSGKCLDITGAGRANGTGIQQSDFGNLDSQKWKLEDY